MWFNAIRCSACEGHLTALPAGTNATSPKVLNWSDKCFSCTFWNRVVKTFHPRTFPPAPDRCGCADAAGLSVRVLRLHTKNVREIVYLFIFFGGGESGIKCETAKRRDRRCGTRTSWFVVFQHHRQVESSPRRGADARPPRTHIYLCWRPGCDPPHALPSNSIKVDQFCRSSSLRNQVILQQAVKTWDVLTGTSPVHLQGSRGWIKRTSLVPPPDCLFVFLRAHTHRQTHSLSHAYTMRAREGERERGGVEVGGDDSGGFTEGEAAAVRTVMESHGGEGGGMERNVPLTSS